MQANGNAQESPNLEDAEVRDLILLAGGLSLVVFGVGLIMTNRGLRKTVMSTISRTLPDLEEPLRAGIAGLMPDVERYMRIRAM
jgi:hypothetical protein